MSGLESVGTCELISEMLEIFNEVQGRPKNELDDIDIRRLSNLKNGIDQTILDWIIEFKQK